MEEVVGSIPTRSTKSTYDNLRVRQLPAFRCAESDELIAVVPGH
jgi:hypothetical protein